MEETVEEIAKRLIECGSGFDKMLGKVPDKGSALDFGVFLDPVDRIVQASRLFLNGTIDAPTYRQQLTAQGSNLLRRWIEIKREAHPDKLPEQGIADKIALFEKTNRVDEKQFMEVAYALQTHNPWIDLERPGDKPLLDPIYATIFDSARACKRIARSKAPPTIEGGGSPSRN